MKVTTVFLALGVAAVSNAAAMPAPKDDLIGFPPGQKPPSQGNEIDARDSLIGVPPGQKPPSQN
ncbi:hypothetical protein NUU61_009301 [Penicillium alfredii]|uniref:Uncharacterized protein n=1 Tax=Penicillium alfredii TaxID=1506179 RepID=A0A9W9JXK0_9EURO|nr:uncharacterized protein NUU61_009301 [Penicillium alfredii]KAJ5084722.1 hypothetical protein NUU61_009301 [Penicillium alfredii]